MSRTARQGRAERLEQVGTKLGRELSTQTILFHQAVADRLGVTPTDHKCLGFIAEADHPVTAGELAVVTGLTTGAITGVIDRLEAAGLAVRERDPHDRRRVVVKPAPGAFERVLPLFEGIARASHQLASQYSDHELDIIEHFMQESATMLREETARLRAAQKA